MKIIDLTLIALQRHSFDHFSYTPLHCLFMARRGPRQSLGVYRRESLPQLKNENKKLVLDFLDILTIHAKLLKCTTGRGRGLWL